MRDRMREIKQYEYNKLIGSSQNYNQSGLVNIDPVYADQEIEKEENGRLLICWILAATALFTASGLIFIISKVME